MLTLILLISLTVLGSMLHTSILQQVKETEAPIITPNATITKWHSAQLPVDPQKLLSSINWALLGNDRSIFPSTTPLPILLIIQITYSQTQFKSSKRKVIRKNRLLREKCLNLSSIFCISCSIFQPPNQYLNLNGYKKATGHSQINFIQSMSFTAKYFIIFPIKSLT